MHFGFRGATVAFAMTMVCFGSTAVRAGDDGAAPLWVGIGSIFGGLGFGGLGFWGKEDKPPIEYREHGKIVVPPKIDLPPPGATMTSEGGEWPVNQEAERKKIEKEKAKDYVAGQGDARLRYSHPFPANTPVTVRATDQTGPAPNCPNGKCESSSVLGSLNPMSWVGMGKSKPLGPEPDREWLTDPPKGYRAPVGQAAN
jgi:hypothetical protein